MYVNVNTVCEATGALKIKWTEFSSTITMFFECDKQTVAITHKYSKKTFEMPYINSYNCFCSILNQALSSVNFLLWFENVICFLLFKWFKWMMTMLMPQPR